ncbi:MAG: Clp protease N-terminal domain-containing protein, partial [Bacteroidia bacterium]
MNFNQFTIKAQEAVQQAQQVAAVAAHPSIDTAHLLKGILLTDEQLSGFLFKKMGVNPTRIAQGLDALLQALPKVSGSNQLQLSSSANQVLIQSLSFLKEFGDEFVSIEHLLLALAKSNDAVGNLLKDAGVQEKALKAAIKELRGGESVKSQDAEATYQSLNKYAKNLNDLAKTGKLDPVIGRDEEI